MVLFVREETWIVARFTMEYPPRTQLRFLFFYFPVLKIGPWANPINDRLMIRLTTINVKIKSPIYVSITMIYVLIVVRFMFRLR